MIFSLLVHKESFVGETGVSSGNFLIDSTLGRDTLFGIYVEDEEDHLIKSIRFTDSKGKSYGPFHRMSSDFDLVNFKTINFPAGQSPPFSAVSINFIYKFLCSYNNCSNMYYVLFVFYYITEVRIISIVRPPWSGNVGIISIVHPSWSHLGNFQIVSKVIATTSGFVVIIYYQTTITFTKKVNSYT